MNFTVSYAQFKLLKSTMGVQAVVLYCPDTSVPPMVVCAAILDPKLGGSSFDWSDPTQMPPVTTFLADLPGALEVASITG